jgi:hypothetical protein
VASILLSFLAVFSTAAVAAAETECRAAQNCTECVALDHGVCAWCSGVVRYLNGTWSEDHCVRQIDYGNTMLCFEQLSLGTCVSGYQCDMSVGQCVQTEDVGAGDTLDHCQGTCNCTSPGCGQFGCVSGANDMFQCLFDPGNNSSSTTTLSKCSDSCGTSAATPIPMGPGGCTPACTVPCHPFNADCCDGGKCTFDIVWNDHRCHIPGRYC